MTLFTQEWGKCRPVIMLHPLALESTAFRSVARLRAGRDVHTISVDLPGFGRTPGPDAPLTPACMAEPVIELARSLATPPVVVGMSMGGRVALEARPAFAQNWLAQLAIPAAFVWGERDALIPASPAAARRSKPSSASRAASG